MPVLHGRIVSAIVDGDRVRLVINRGAEHGVAAGYRGMLIQADEQIPGGHFTVTTATDRESRAVVGLSIDTVAKCTSVLFDLSG